MTTFEDNLLAGRFAALAPEPLAGDWADVVARAGVTRRGQPFLRRSRSLSRRRRLVVVLAVVALVIMGAASSFALRAIVFDRGGVTAFPPRGTKPSTPAAGRLVIHYHGRAGGWPVVQVWVYADGRIIRRTAGGPAGVGSVRTGFIERRLANEGVELLRSKLVATGLVGRDRVYATRMIDFGLMQVWNGTRLVRVAWGPRAGWKRQAAVPTDEQTMTIARIVDWMLAPERALPTYAWETRQPRAFVPSTYAICFRRPRAGDADLSPDIVDRPSRAMRFLPAAARGLLGGRTRAFSSYGVRSLCSEVSIEDARALYVILSEFGYEPDPFRTGWITPPYAVFENVRFRVPHPNRTLYIAFEPILPHGQWELMPG
jgi:hypothetical protein